ncbi:MAG: hypothetical protein JJU05_16920, partial [Verrucomicrobia bacterium]|nr:hypothetical protein [Verrucomicrobiota bacterium]
PVFSYRQFYTTFISALTVHLGYHASSTIHNIARISLEGLKAAALFHTFFRISDLAQSKASWDYQHLSKRSTLAALVVLRMLFVAIGS